MCIDSKKYKLNRVAYWLRNLLENRKLPWIAALVGVMLCIPSIRVGLLLDDDFHRLALTRPDLSMLSRSPAELFVFVEGDVDANRMGRTMGILPWWSSDNLRIAFFRPVTGLTHWLDYQVWPNQPIFMHIHSLLWFGAAIAAAAFFFRRMFGAIWIAGLAALLFAVDDAHGMPAVWIANRNALLGMFFGLLTLIFHDRWREKGSWLCLFLAPLTFLLGLLSKESTVAVTAYIFAYALFLDRGRWVSRFVSLVPCALIGIVWLVVYKHLGYGISGSSWYIDPGEDPVVFARAVAAHAPNLLAWQWLIPSNLQWPLSPQTAKYLWLLTMALLVIIAVIMIPHLRRDRLSRYWVLGMLMSVPLACSAYPSDRLLTFIGIGGTGLIAQFIAFGLRQCNRKQALTLQRLAAAGIATVLIAIHLFIAPLQLTRTEATLADYSRSIKQASDSLPSTSEIGFKTVLIVNSPTYASYAYGVLNLFAQNKPYLCPTFVLGTGSRNIEIHRCDKSTLLIRPDGGFLAPVGNPRGQTEMAQILFDQRRTLETIDRLYRGPEPVVAGQHIQLLCAAVEITAITEDGRPAEVAFNFISDLENQLFHWLQWRDGRYVQFEIPEVGQTLIMPTVAL